MVVFDPNVSVSGAGPQGVPGDSAFVYIRYAADNIGTGISSTPDASRPYIAVLTTDTEIVAPVAADFTGLWFLYKGATGATGINGTDPLWLIGASDPTVNSDTAHGYSAGSGAINTATHKVFFCESSANGAAVWHQSWPALTGDMDFSLVGIWRVFPGTPTRVGDAQFTITDPSNANLYDLAFPKGTIIKWEKSGGGFQTAIVKDATYGANTITINILGNTLAAGFTLMKYCIMKPVKEEFIVPGKLPAAAITDIGKTIFAFRDILIFSALVRYKTAATTTKGVWDINDDGTTIFTTKPEIAATATKGTDTVCNCVLATAVTVVVVDSAITLDYDSGHATTPGSDAYVELLYMPASWRYSP